MLELLNGAFKEVQALRPFNTHGQKKKKKHKFAIKFSLSSPTIVTAIILKPKSPFLLLWNICNTTSERLKGQFTCSQQVFLYK